MKLSLISISYFTNSKQKLAADAEVRLSNKKISLKINGKKLTTQSIGSHFVTNGQDLICLIICHNQASFLVLNISFFSLYKKNPDNLSKCALLNII